MRDPVGTTANLVDNLDLPEDRKSAVKLLLEGALESDPAGAQGAPPADDSRLPDDPPKWAQPLIADFVGRHQAAEQQGHDQALAAVLDHWDTLDKQANVQTPRETQLAFVASYAGAGTTPEQIAEVARNAANGFREHVLQGAVSEVRNASGAPLPVPGSAVAASPGVRPTNLKQATALARQALESGQLPS